MPTSTKIILVFLGLMILYSLYSGVRDILIGRITIGFIIGEVWREVRVPLAALLLGLLLTLLFPPTPVDPDSIPSPAGALSAQEQEALIKWE